MRLFRLFWGEKLFSSVRFQTCSQRKYNALCLSCVTTEKQKRKRSQVPHHTTRRTSTTKRNVQSQEKKPEAGSAHHLYKQMPTNENYPKSVSSQSFFLKSPFWAGSAKFLVFVPNLSILSKMKMCAKSTICNEMINIA